MLDATRGVAILAILFANVGEMGSSFTARFAEGWSAADKVVFTLFHLFLFGTQRGLLQLLFGAGVAILANRRSAWLFYRRTLLLIGFGLIDVFALLWDGDVLVIYGVAALAAFPLHRLRARWLLMLAPLYACWATWSVWPYYVQQRALASAVATAQAHRRVDVALTPADRAALQAWRAQRADAPPGSSLIAERAAEAAARSSGPLTYARLHWQHWLAAASSRFALIVVGEALCTMLLGMALWKLGIIQGRRDKRFYLILMLVGYVFGIAARGSILPAVFAMAPNGSPALLLDEWARLGITLGHLAAINLLMQAGWTLRPLQAAGRGAFSLYLLQSAICLWLVFAPWGPPLWNRYGWAGLAAIAALIDLTLLFTAVWWFHRFAIGPLEWVWRSAAYGTRQS